MDADVAQLSGPTRVATPERFGLPSIGVNVPCPEEVGFPIPRTALWQSHGECRALADAALHCDCAFVTIDDPLHETEAHAGAVVA